MKTIIRITASFYFLGLFYTFFLARRRPGPTFFLHKEPVNLSPITEKIYFFSSRQYWAPHDRWTFYTDFFGNILIFIPFAFFLMAFKYLQPGKIIAIAFLTSVSVEILQFVFSIGVADIDDVILNTLGAVIGTVMYSLCIKKYAAKNFLHK